MKSRAGCLAMVLFLAACSGSEKEAGEDIKSAGLLSASVVPSGASPLHVAVAAAGEALPGRAPLPAPRLDGSILLEIAIDSTAGEPVPGIAACLVTESGDEAAAVELHSIGEIEPGASRSVTARFVPTRPGEAVALAVAYGDGRDRRRILVPLGAVEPGPTVERVSVLGEEGYEGKAGRVLPVPVARALGYDVLLATEEEIEVEFALSGSELRFAAASQISLVHERGVPVRARIVSSGFASDKTQRVRTRLDTHGSGPGRAEFTLAARFLAEGVEKERTWRFGAGVQEITSLEDGDQLRFAFRLPSGASGEWAGPARLAGRLPPPDLDRALAHVRARVEEDFPVAVRASRITYAPSPVQDRPSPEALRAELQTAVGGTAGFALLPTQVRSDLLDGLATQPALVLALTARAGDLGYLGGPAVLATALSGWTAEGGAVDLAGARWPGEPVSLSRDEFERFLAPLAARPLSARWGTAAPVSLEGVAEIEPDATPLSLVYDLGRVEERETAAFALVLTSATGTSISVSTQAAGDSVEFHIDRIERGYYRAQVVARWPDGRLCSGASLGVRVMALPPPDGKPVADELLDLLSPDERERLNREGTFLKSVAVERQGRFKLSTRRLVVAKGRQLDCADISVELVSVRYDGTADRTMFSVRMISRVAKTWNLSVATETTPIASEERPEPASVRLEKDSPELVSFSVPGRFGESLTLLEHSISGSPVSRIETIVARIAGGSTGPGTKALSEPYKGPYGVLIVGGDADNVNVPGSVSSAKSSPFDLSVFGFIPLELKASTGTLDIESFRSAGGEIRFTGTGGPAAKAEVRNRPAGLAEGVRLLVPAGTVLSGGEGVQNLVVPRPVLVSTAGGVTRFDAYCLEIGKPFPPSGNPLDTALPDARSAAFSRVVSNLLESGAYPGLAGLSPAGRLTLVQMAVWADLGLAGRTDSDPAAKGDLIEGAFSDAAGRIQDLSAVDRASFATEAANLALDAAFVVAQPVEGPKIRFGGGSDYGGGYLTICDNSCKCHPGVHACGCTDVCPSCGGSGKGKPWRCGDCPSCWALNTSKCPTCGGTGVCSLCKGSGKCIVCLGGTRSVVCRCTVPKPGSPWPRDLCFECLGTGRNKFTNSNCDYCGWSGKSADCRKCGGTRKYCSSCEGTGTCRACHGDGRCWRCQRGKSCTPHDRCPACNGTGRADKCVCPLNCSCK